jgi:hypothetical protein
VGVDSSVTPIDQLRATKKTLPPELREQILAPRSEAISPLIEILNDEQLGTSESPAEGWPPIHAIGLLADLKAADAVEPMLDVLVETNFEHIINSSLLGRLREFGAAVLEPALLRLKDAREEDVDSRLSPCSPSSGSRRSGSSMPSATSSTKYAFREAARDELEDFLRRRRPWFDRTNDSAGHGVGLGEAVQRAAPEHVAQNHPGRRLRARRAVDRYPAGPPMSDPQAQWEPAGCVTPVMVAVRP